MGTLKELLVKPDAVRITVHAARRETMQKFSLDPRRTSRREESGSTTRRRISRATPRRRGQGPAGRRETSGATPVAAWPPISRWCGRTTGGREDSRTVTQPAAAKEPEPTTATQPTVDQAG